MSDKFDKFNNNLVKLNKGLGKTNISITEIKKKTDKLDFTNKSIAIGLNSGKNLIGKRNNILLGENAGKNLITGDENIFMGKDTGLRNVTGDKNIIIGRAAGTNILSADENIIIGTNTADNLSYGNNNIVIGSQTASNLTGGSNNILLGDYNGANVSNTLVIQGKDETESLITGYFISGQVHVPDLSVNRNATVSGKLSIGGTAWIEGETTVVDDLNVSGNLSVSTNAIIYGNMYLGTLGTGTLSTLTRPTSLFLASGNGDDNYDHCVIERREYNVKEKHELVFFSGNDVDSEFGTDRIRLYGGEIRMDIFDSATTDRTYEGDNRLKLTTDTLTVSGNIVNNRVGTGAGIYTFSKTIAPSSSSNIFTVTNDHGGQNFICMVNCSTSDFSVCQNFSVVAAYGKTPSVNTLSDTGGFVAGGATNDFTVTFTNSAASAVTCSINNTSVGGDGDAPETGNFLITVFLGGSVTTTTVTTH